MTMKLINVSGEPREYSENGFIYEFPFPADESTQVPDEVGKKLLESGQYELSEVKKKTVKKESDEVEENGI